MIWAYDKGAAYKGGDCMTSITYSEVDALPQDLYGARLDVWGGQAHHGGATLRTLVNHAFREARAGAFRVDIQLPDNRWLNLGCIRQLYARFENE